jgi:EmrB/QacA subfamily drug resistance transporter
VLTGFLLSSAVTMPITGWLGKRIGYGVLYFASILLFTVASGLCTLSWNLDSLIAARVIQGVGAGAIQPTGMAVLTHVFPPNERGRAIGIWGVGVLLGPTLGPTTGGYLTDWFGWRSIFTVNLPIGLLTLFFSAAVLGFDRDERPPGFDWAGYGTLTLALVAGLLTLDKGGEEGWGSGIILFGAAVTAVAVLLFLALEWGAESPVVPLRLFLIKDFSLAMGLSLLRALGLFGSVFLIPLFLQTVQGRDTIDTGLMLMPGAIFVGISMPVSGMIMDRYGGRWPTVAGSILTGLSFFLYRHVDPLSSPWDIIFPQFFRGVGLALIMTPITTVGMNSVSRADTATAAWLLNINQRMGASISIAALSTLLDRGITQQMDRLGTIAGLHAPPPAEFLHALMGLGLSSGEAGAAAMAGMQRVVARAAATLTYQNLFVLAGTLMLLGILPSIFLPTKHGRPLAR